MVKWEGGSEQFGNVPVKTPGSLGSCNRDWDFEGDEKQKSSSKLPNIHLLLARKAMINLDSVLKSRDMTFPAKVRTGKALVFPVVMYRCESWTIKKPEHRRIDAFELWCWRRLFGVT